MIGFTLAAFAAAAIAATPSLPEHKAAAGARVYIISRADGATVAR